MKTHSSPVAVANPAPSETAIRGYAFFLYEQSGHAPGRDLDNWLEASAHLHARAVKEKTAHTTSRRHA